MVNLYTQKDKNIRKTFLLMALFFIIVIAVGWIFAQAYGQPFILYIAVGISLFVNILAYWKSDKIALSMSGAKQLKREQAVELFRIIENLAITAGLPMPRIYIIPGQQINAFATGRNPEHAAIAVTQGTLQKLNKNELQGVIAHELSHIGNRDILISTVIVVLAGIIAITSDIFLRMTLWGGRGSDKAGAIKIVIALIAAILAPIAATIIKLAISRQREFLADSSGALLTRYPEGLASALEKIGHDHTPMKKAKNSTAHLFIANPLKGKKAEKSWFTKLFMTHPPIEERIKILRGMRI